MLEIKIIAANAKTIALVIPRSVLCDEESLGLSQRFLAPALSAVEVSLGMTVSAAIIYVTGNAVMVCERLAAGTLTNAGAMPTINHINKNA
jgi:hypothetical protein